MPACWCWRRARPVGLVTLDLGGTFGLASLEQLRESARRSSRISYLLVTATHTHAGPVIQDEYPSGEVPAWEDYATIRLEQGAIKMRDWTGTRLGEEAARVAKKAASEGGYGTASATTWVEVGAGERMVDHALTRVYEMLGRLVDVPEDLKK